ncbi:MAG: hypothetical protein KAS38_00205, partial [Anaerolineales bacterium]|nr:hypothetical protein [Anaerolineales bacterium]
MNFSTFPPFPASRTRRLRLTPQIRDMVRETVLSPKDFVYPLFIRHGNDIRQEISSMPGQFQWTIDLLPAEAESIARLSIPAVILFGLPAEKDVVGIENFAP